MAAQAGKDILIQVDPVPDGTFVTVGGMRSKSISFNRETIDVTCSDSAGLARELFSGGGVFSAAISGSGVFKDTAQDETVRAAHFTGALLTMRFTIPDFGTITGLFQVTTLEFAGEYNDTVTFSQTYESAGDLTYAAI